MKGDVYTRICHSVHGGTDTTLGRQLLGRHPPRQDTLLGQTPSRQTPPPKMATSVDSVHPTGRSSCRKYVDFNMTLTLYNLDLEFSTTFKIWIKSDRFFLNGQMVIWQLFCRQIAIQPFRLKLKRKWNMRHTECMILRCICTQKMRFLAQTVKVIKKTDTHRDLT